LAPGVSVSDKRKFYKIEKRGWRDIFHRQLGMDDFEKDCHVSVDGFRRHLRLRRVDRLLRRRRQRRLSKRRRVETDGETVRRCDAAEACKIDGK
jgi:hypothetical protein